VKPWITYEGDGKLGNKEKIKRRQTDKKMSKEVNR
jgi:hypothetical protein